MDDFTCCFVLEEESPESVVAWSQVMLSLPQSSQFNLIRVYVSAPQNMHMEVDIMKKVSLPVHFRQRIAT